MQIANSIHIAFLIFVISPNLVPAQSLKLTQAKNLIESHQRKIFWVMHPTVPVTNLQKVDLINERHTSDGTHLDYTFRFKGIGGEHKSTMRFIFSTDGTFTAVETIESSSLSPPFAAADLVIDVLKELLKDELAPKEQKIADQALGKVDSKALLQLVLRIDQGRLSSMHLTDKQLSRLINTSSALGAKDRAEWISKLPNLQGEQRQSLIRILTNHEQRVAEIEKKFNGGPAYEGPAAQMNLAKLYSKKKEFNQALVVLDEFIRENPMRIDARILRAETLQRSGDLGSAIIDLNFVTENAPRDVRAYYKRAIVFEEMNEFDKALQDYEKAHSVDPENNFVRYQLAWFLVTCKSQKHKAPERALQLVNVKVVAAEDEPLFLMVRAVAHAELGDFVKAKNAVSDALRKETLINEIYGEKLILDLKSMQRLFDRKKPYR